MFYGNSWNSCARHWIALNSVAVLIVKGWGFEEIISSWHSIAFQMDTIVNFIFENKFFKWFHCLNTWNSFSELNFEMINHSCRYPFSRIFAMCCTFMIVSCNSKQKWSFKIYLCPPETDSYYIYESKVTNCRSQCICENPLRLNWMHRFSVDEIHWINFTFRKSLKCVTCKFSINK